MVAAVSNELMPPPGRELKGRQTGNLWLAPALLAFSILIMWLGRVHAPEPLNRWFQPLPLDEPVNVLILLAALIGVAVLHELGHLLAAAALGFEIVGLAFGSWKLQILHGRWKVYRRRHGFTAASVSAVPKDMRQWRAATAIVIAFGPLTTLAAMLACVSLQPTDRLETVFQRAFFQISFLILVVGLIPNRSGDRAVNDTRLLLNLFLKNEGCQEMELNFLLFDQVRQGVRPSEYPADLLKRLAAWQGRNEAQLLFAQTLMQWAMDSKETELAEAWDRRAVALAERASKSSRNSALAHSACFDVIHRRDMESAQNKFESIDFKQLFPPCFEHRARAAQKVALGQHQRAIKDILAAQFSLVQGPSYYAFERSLLENLHLQAMQTGLPAGQKMRASA